MQPLPQTRDSLEMRFDIVIAGAGPLGLCLAAALASGGLRIAVIEPQPLGNLSDDRSN